MCSSKSNDPDYRSEMRQFVQNISSYAKQADPDFIVIPQNGAALVTLNGEADGEPAADYLNAIDGQGQEDLFYGYNNDDEATPLSETNYLIPFLDIAKSHSKQILAIDYCFTNSKIDDSYSQNNSKGYLSFAAQDRALNMVATYPAAPYNNNTGSITTLAAAKNFLYIINSENYATKADFITAVDAANYDAVIIDAFFNDTALTSADVNALKTKPDGSSRLVIAYMSIGEAEDYRYYWQSSWNTNPPAWLDKENPDWEGNYKVRYWYSSWQEIIYGNDSSYLKKILDAGFDGVYLDIIDAFEYYE
jgi:cysteinyl-tRNA synthetase